MLRYVDLLPNLNYETLQNNAKQLEQNVTNLDLNNANDKWLVVTYLYAKLNKFNLVH